MKLKKPLKISGVEILKKAVRKSFTKNLEKNNLKRKGDQYDLNSGGINQNILKSIRIFRFNF